ncbi:RND transporter, partial [Achromatium sp. WMS1]
RPMESWSGNRQYGAERYSDIFSSRANIEKARSAIAQLHAQIQQIDAKLRNAKSVAPFDGVIMKKFVEIGDTMQPGQPLLKYADMKYLQVEVDIPARLRPALRKGIELKAQLDFRKPMIVPVRVAQIFPMADVQRHTIKVKLDLPIGVPAAPGMYAKVLVPDPTAPTKDNPEIPISAIRYNGSLPGVYVRANDGTNQLRLVRIGEQLPNGFITILSGLEPNEEVLVNPASNMTQGWTGTGARVPNR